MYTSPVHFTEHSNFRWGIHLAVQMQCITWPFSIAFHIVGVTPPLDFEDCICHLHDTFLIGFTHVTMFDGVMFGLHVCIYTLP